MHAIVGASRLEAEAGPELARGILQRLSQAPEFVSGTFTRSADGERGRSMVLFESEQAATTALENARANLPADVPMQIESLEVYEVVAHA